MRRDQEEAVLNTKQAANTGNRRVCAANRRRSSNVLITTNESQNFCGDWEFPVAVATASVSSSRTFDVAAPDRRSARAEVP